MRALFVIFILVVGFAWFATNRSPPPAQPAAFDPQKAFDAASALENQWRDFKAGKGGKPPSAFDVDRHDAGLREIPLDWPKADEAVALIQRLRAERAAISKAFDEVDAKQRAAAASEREKKLLAARRAYPKTAENLFLDGGKDVYVSAEGKELRTLRVKYVLMSRPLVHQISKSTKTVEAWRNAGFHTVVLTDGYRETWSLDLK